MFFNYFLKGFQKVKVKWQRENLFGVFLVLRKSLNMLKWIKVFIKENKMEKSLDKNQGFLEKRVLFLKFVFWTI